jgi:hypothetical protein
MQAQHARGIRITSHGPPGKAAVLCPSDMTQPLLEDQLHLSDGFVLRTQDEDYYPTIPHDCRVDLLSMALPERL